MTENYLILVINPGSTSTKVSLSKNRAQIAFTSYTHEIQIITKFKSMWDQFDLRLNAVKNFLKEQNVQCLDAVVGRGGLLKPLRRGTYLIDFTMIEDARKGVQGEHISNMGCVLAFEIAEEFGCPAYTVDPVSVDEFDDVARISGHPQIQRRSLAHSLSLRAAFIWACEEKGKNPDTAQMVVAHLGGGISVAPLRGGRVIDVNDASSGGPFSPDRSGSLPLMPLVDLCFSGRYSEQDIKKMIMGGGGLMAYLGTSNLPDVEKKIVTGDTKAKLIFNAMIYQIAKEIGAMATVLYDGIDAVVLTGGLTHSKMLVSDLKKRLEFIAPVVIYEGELEMKALAEGALRVLQGVEKVKKY
ncbi:butyrate kinase [candidate division KSB1 bacterium]|nr:butyrate kinase [candidate division KSB1 bacterium]